MTRRSIETSNFGWAVLKYLYLYLSITLSNNHLVIWLILEKSALHHSKYRLRREISHNVYIDPTVVNMSRVLNVNATEQFIYYFMRIVRVIYTHTQPLTQKVSSKIYLVHTKKKEEEKSSVCAPLFHETHQNSPFF